MRFILAGIHLSSLLYTSRGYSASYFKAAYSPFHGRQSRRFITSFGATKSQALPEDCGCPIVEYSGKPSPKAKAIVNPKSSLADLELFNLDGLPTTLNQVEFSKTNNQLVRYDRLRQSKLLAFNQNHPNNQIGVSVISIGKPEVGKAVCQHLELVDPKSWIYSDPTSALYEAIDLNSGLKNFITMDTAFTFRDRFLGLNNRQDGMSELMDVLGKWKNAVYTPPRSDQAFQQGGVLIFAGEKDDLVFAHYDASTGAHLEAEAVFQKAFDVALVKESRNN